MDKLFGNWFSSSGFTAWKLHTREDYIEILDVIDKYEKYCDSHKDYENNRAVHAIANVERCYDDRLKNNDFA